jgi:hypothetical protein
MFNQYRMILLGMIVAQGASLVAMDPNNKKLSNSGKKLEKQQQGLLCCPVEEKKNVFNWPKELGHNACRFRNALPKAQ